MNPSSIRYIPRAEIDIQKWDQCISNASNGLIYAYSFYLDAMAEDWEALVVEEYNAVMPLPLARKFGIKTWPHVPFIQQLGIIGNLSSDERHEIAKLISLHLTYGDLNFNYENGWLASQFKMRQRTNFILDLSASYSTISSRYNRDLNNNLKKSARELLKYEKEEDIEMGIEFYKSHYNHDVFGATSNDFEKFHKLCVILQEKQMVFCRKVISSDGTILAIGLFLKDKKRIYNVLNTTTGKGRMSEANHLLFDQLIREFAGQPISLDFEGSDLPGVQYFYSKFDPSNQPYFHYHIGAPTAIVHLVKRALHANG